MAIEIISTGQTSQEMLNKAKLLVNEGVKTVWTVEPFSQTVFVTTANGNHCFHREIVCCGDIEVDFSKIFANSASSAS